MRISMINDNLLFEEVKNIIVYHGTTDKNLRSILKVGLNPRAKERVWATDTDMGVYRSSRESYGGVYFSRRIITAESSGREAVRRLGGKNPLIIVASIQPKSSLPDEDNFMSRLGTLVELSLHEFSGYSLHDYSLYYYYIYYFGDRISIIKKAVEKMIENVLEVYKEIIPIKYLDKDEFDKIVSEFFKSAIYRVASHEWYKSKPYDRTRLLSWAIDGENAEECKRKSREYYDKIISEEAAPPSIQDAELDYMEKAKDILNYFKRSVLSFYTDKQFNYNYRVLFPVTFSGSNKILAILRVIPSTKREREYYDDVELLYGNIPKQFFKDAEEQGNSFEVIDRRKEYLKRFENNQPSKKLLDKLKYYIKESYFQNYQ